MRCREQVAPQVVCSAPLGLAICGRAPTCDERSFPFEVVCLVWDGFGDVEGGTTVSHWFGASGAHGVEQVMLDQGESCLLERTEKITGQAD